MDALIQNGLDFYYFEYLAAILAFLKGSAVSLSTLWAVLKIIAKATKSTEDDKVLTLISNIVKGIIGKVRGVRNPVVDESGLVRLPTLFMALVLTIVVGCAGTQIAPSVCDTAKKSLLCDIAREQGVRLEDVGAALIVINSIAIGEGLYTSEQAKAVLVDLRAILDNPVSYAFFRANVFDRIQKYPELIEVCKIYFDRLAGGQIMYGADRDILISWIDKRIEVLE